MTQEQQQRSEERIVRILAQDIEGRMTVYAGLTTVKGVSWAISKAVCTKLGLDPKKKIGALTPEEISKITAFFKNPELPTYLLNRQKDIDTGEDKHLLGVDLELQNEFDVKRLKKVKSYRGIRHASRLPLRGQRTKSNFRRNRAKGSGIKRKNKK